MPGGSMRRHDWIPRDIYIYIPRTYIYIQYIKQTKTRPQEAVLASSPQRDLQLPVPSPRNPNLDLKLQTYRHNSVSLLTVPEVRYDFRSL